MTSSKVEPEAWRGPRRRAPLRLLVLLRTAHRRRGALRYRGSGQPIDRDAGIGDDGAVGRRRNRAWRAVDCDSDTHSVPGYDRRPSSLGEYASHFVGRCQRGMTWNRDPHNRREKPEQLECDDQLDERYAWPDVGIHGLGTRPHAVDRLQERRGDERHEPAKRKDERRFQKSHRISHRSRCALLLDCRRMCQHFGESPAILANPHNLKHRWGRYGLSA
jgi:hypothetical protein